MRYGLLSCKSVGNVIQADTVYSKVVCII